MLLTSIPGSAYASAVAKITGGIPYLSAPTGVNYDLAVNYDDTDHLAKLRRHSWRWITRRFKNHFTRRYIESLDILGKRRASLGCRSKLASYPLSCS